MWFAIWVILALEALHLFALIAVLHWRLSAQPLLVELRQLSRATSTLAAKVEELNAATAPRQPVPALFATASQRSAWQDLRADIRATRAARRDERRERTYARWRRIGQPF